MAELEIDQSNLTRVNQDHLNRTKSIYRTMCVNIVTKGAAGGGVGWWPVGGTIPSAQNINPMAQCSDGDTVLCRWVFWTSRRSKVLNKQTIPSIITIQQYYWWTLVSPTVSNINQNKTGFNSTGGTCLLLWIRLQIEIKWMTNFWGFWGFSLFQENNYLLIIIITWTFLRILR